MRSPIVIACSFAVAGLSQAAVVFSDDFSEAPGTLIVGKSADIGSAWSGSAGSPPLAVSAANTADTSGDARTIFGDFTGTLASGQAVTVSFDTLSLGNFFSGGYAGVSLYAGIDERIFIGDAGGTGSTFWAVDGNAVGLNLSSDATTATSAEFTYLFDTGAWTLTTTSGVNLSGTGVANIAFDRIRIANGAGGDIQVDNLVVDISAVPEPTTLALVGLGSLCAFRRRR